MRASGTLAAWISRPGEAAHHLRCAPVRRAALLPTSRRRFRPPPLHLTNPSGYDKSLLPPRRPPEPTHPHLRGGALAGPNLPPRLIRARPLRTARRPGRRSSRAKAARSCGASVRSRIDLGRDEHGADPVSISAPFRRPSCPLGEEGSIMGGRWTPDNVCARPSREGRRPGGG